MIRYITYSIVFISAFAAGLCVTSGEESLTDSVQLPAKIDPPQHYDFFSASQTATSPKLTNVPVQYQTDCRDEKMLPVWSALMRDEASRDVLEYSTEADVTDCSRMLEIKTVDLNGDRKSEVLVRAVSVPSCGAVGNCDFWILEKLNGQYRIILHGDDYWDVSEMGEQVLRKRTNGYYEIRLKGHFSAAETSYTTYRHNGDRYVESGCLYQVPDHARSSSTVTKWHFITCKEFENSPAN